MPDMAPPYEGPKRAEILLLCMKYNFSHHTVDQIRDTNITAADIDEVNKLIESKQNASTLQRQADDLIRQLEALSKAKAKPRLSLQDYKEIVKAAKGIAEDSAEMLERARFEKARCEKGAEEAGKQLQQKQPVKKVVKPQPPKTEKDKERDRRARAERKAVQAYLNACKLAEEVKGYGNGTD